MLRLRLRLHARTRTSGSQATHVGSGSSEPTAWLPPRQL
jgi:hypothetical protein